MACNRPGPNQAHHVSTRGAGGDDVPQNLMPLCEEHHQAWHQDPGKAARKFPGIRHWLMFAERWDVLRRLGLPSK